MDYSAVANESSPWGSSSPRADRSGFSAGENGPDSPTAIARHYNAEPHDNLPDPALPAATQEASHPNEYRQHDDLSDRLQQQSISSESGSSQVQYSAQQQQQQVAQQQQRVAAARYHNVRQQRPVPSYKLQAKVTALERTGRKDPVLRFDVYVG